MSSIKTKILLKNGNLEEALVVQDKGQYLCCILQKCDERIDVCPFIKNAIYKEYDAKFMEVVPEDDYFTET